MTVKLTDELKLKMRDEFVHGYTDEQGVLRFPTIEALQKRNKVARATLYRAAKDEDWQGQKDRYQTELTLKQDADRMSRMLEDSRRLDDSAVQIAQAMMTKVGRRLQRSLEAEQEGRFANALSSGDLHQLSSVMANAQKIGKLALGQAQEISKVSADVSNPEAFQHIMEQLDGLAAARSQGDVGSVH